MSQSSHCPKCDFSSGSSFSECPSCGVIVSKFMAIEKEKNKFDSEQDNNKESAMGTIENAHAFVIRQQKEWGEILTGFETKNKYEIFDSWGNLLFQAEEEGGSFLTVITRQFLKALRPFTMNIFSSAGAGLFILKRPFRFFFYELHVCNSRGNLLGKIKRRFSLLRRIYSVYDMQDKELYQLFGPILRPWTFLIKKNDQELGKIVKKWSGLAKEVFTDADNFGIQFPEKININTKAILLGAVFLIDFAHFEDSKTRNNSRLPH